jgi:hypothetical protein
MSEKFRQIFGCALSDSTVNALDLKSMGVDQLLITLGDARVVFQFQPLAEGGHRLAWTTDRVRTVHPARTGRGRVRRSARRLNAFQAACRVRSRACCWVCESLLLCAKARHA